MVPSLPLVLGRPAMPSDVFAQIGVQVGEDGRIGDRLDQPVAKDGRRDAKDEITFLRGLSEVVLGDVAAGCIGAAGDGEQVVHSAVNVAQSRACRGSALRGPGR